MLPNQQHYYKDAKTIKDVISPEFVQTLNLKSYQFDVKTTRGHVRKERFAQKVFATFLDLVITDLIENNNKFLSPTKNWFTIFIREVSPMNKKKILASKAYQNVDLIQSDFKFYEFVFYSSYLYDKYRSIRISYIKYKELIAKVNEGKRYYSR